MDALSDRISVVGQVWADPPLVHTRTYGPGVWATEKDCYEYLAERCPPGTRTLETGLGISTVLFTSWGCEHTCVVPSEEEVQRCVEYLDERKIDRSQLTFHVGLSEEVLPQLEPSPLDLVFVDGGHGFPTAIIDFFYTAGRLMQGGWLVLDDMQLPSVRLGLVDFLELDPRWHLEGRTPKWAGWRRAGSGPVSEHESAQEFLGRDARREPLPRRLVPRPLRPFARKARHVVKHWVTAPKHDADQR